MKILALDTSQIQAAACLLDGERVAASASGSTSVSHSESLLALLDGVLAQAGARANDVDAFAAGVGPGSFTGIRIGCATVKALAQALGKPVVAFSSLRALALSRSETGPGDAIAAMVSAYQGLVFVGFAGAGGGWEEAAARADAWVSERAALRPSGGLVICGSGGRVYGERIRAAADAAGVAIRLEGPQWPSPEGVARAVIEKLSAGSGAALRPYSELSANYLRLSQAEIKLQGGTP